MKPLGDEKITHTFASKIVFFLLASAIVWTTVFYGTVHQPTLALFYIWMGLVLVFWAFDGFFSGKLRFSKSLLQIPLAAAIVYGVIQIIPLGSIGDLATVTSIPRTISLDPNSTKLTTIHFFALLIFFSAALAFLDSFKRLKKLVLVIMIFGFFFAFFAILQSFLSPTKIYGIYETRFGVPFGSFVNRHNYAAFIEMAIAIPLGLLFTGAIEKDKRLLFITAASLMGISLILSGSRGGLVAFFAMLFLLVITTTKNSSQGKMILKGVLAFALVGVVIVGAIMIGGESSLTRLAETAASDDISSNRTQIWSVTLDVIRANFPFGAGFGAFGVAYTPFDTTNGMGRVEQAHNDYLEVIATAGIVGIVLGLSFLIFFFRTALKNIKTENLYRRGVAVGAFAGCFAILIHSLFDFVLHTTAVSLMFLSLLGLLVAAGRSNADDQALYVSQRRRRKKKATVTPIDHGT